MEHVFIVKRVFGIAIVAQSTIFNKLFMVCGAYDNQFACTLLPYDVFYQWLIKIVIHFLL